jgi:pimeloyl-ACP methyl ester carboxylesterase
MVRSSVRVAAVFLSLLVSSAQGAPAATLPALPAAVAQFDAGSLHVARYGKGDPVVLLPGLATGPWEWGDLLQRLAQQHTVFAVSLPGFDGRPVVAGPLIDRVTSDFWKMLDGQKIVRPIVIGHSLGGILAIVLGEQHPERLRGIIAIDGLPIIPGLERVPVEQRAAALPPVAGQTREQFLAFEKSFMRSPLGVLDPELADRAAELEANSDTGAVSVWLREILTSDFRPDLAKITVPLLEIAPYYAPDLANAPVQYTEAQKVEYYRGLLSGTPKVQIVSVSPSRHFAQLDQPDKVFAIVDAFLKQNL